MTTTVYGCSDDLVEIDGDVHDEVSCYDETRGVLLVFSDRTKLRVVYGPEGIWKISVEHKGALLVHIDPCEEETKHGYSDVAYFVSGLVQCDAYIGGRRVKRMGAPP